MNRRQKILIAAAVVVVALGLFLIVYRGSQANYYLTTKELKARAGTLTATRVRVAGRVVNSSVDFDQANGGLYFKIADERGKNVMAVRYGGIPPQTFSPDAKVIVEGTPAKGLFLADKLLVRCPENYLPEKAVSAAAAALKVEGLIYK